LLTGLFIDNHYAGIPEAHSFDAGVHYYIFLYKDKRRRIN